MIFRRVMVVLSCILFVTLIILPIQIPALYGFQLEDHVPILIEGNNDFIATAAVEGWPGNGIEESPIVIAGLEIKGETYGIHIVNVSLYFRIERCIVDISEIWEDLSFGIFIENCNHASIEQCMIINQDTGICLSNSDGAFVNRTEIFDSGCGVLVNDSSSVWLHSLDIVMCSNGIQLNHSVHTYVDQTIVDHCQYTGIACINDTGTMLRHNHIIESEIGILTVENENWVIEESIIQCCDIGIDTFHLNGGYVIRTMIKNCSILGIDLGVKSNNVSIIQCWLGPDNMQNSQDDGDINMWYDNYEHIGNYWSDYSGEEHYLIPGSAESVDAYPLSLEDAPKWEDVVSGGAPLENSTQTTNTTTTYFGDLPSLIFTSASVVVILLIAVVMLRSRKS